MVYIFSATLRKSLLNTSNVKHIYTNIHKLEEGVESSYPVINLTKKVLELNKPNTN